MKKLLKLAVRSVYKDVIVIRLYSHARAQQEMEVDIISQRRFFARTHTSPFQLPRVRRGEQSKPVGAARVQCLTSRSGRTLTSASRLQTHKGPLSCTMLSITTGRGSSRSGPATATCIASYLCAASRCGRDLAFSLARKSGQREKRRAPTIVL